MDDFVDEVPDVDLVSTDEITVHSVVMQNRATLHSLTTFVGISFSFRKDDFNKGRIKAALEENGCRLLGLFPDPETASEFLRFTIEQYIRSYTTIINKLSNFEPVQKRKFLAYLGDDVTASPGLYEVNRTDYEKLKENFAGVRFATDEEARETPLFYSSFVPIHYEKVKSLNLSSLKSLRVIPDVDPSDYPAVCSKFDWSYRIWENLQAKAIQLVKGDRMVKQESLILDAIKLFPESAEEIVDRLTTTYQKALSNEEVNGLSLKMIFGQSEVEYC